MTRPLRVGIAGCGRVASTLHLPALARVPGVEAVARRRSRPRARPAPWRSGSASRASHGDAAELLARRRRPRRGLHAAGAARRRRARRARGRQARARREAADARPRRGRCARRRGRAVGGVAACGFNLRVPPPDRRGPACARRGRAGRAADGADALDAGPRPAGWRTDPREGGRALWEMGIHHLDLMRHLTGAEPVDLRAAGNDARDGAQRPHAGRRRARQHAGDGHGRRQRDRARRLARAARRDDVRRERPALLPAGQHAGRRGDAGAGGAAIGGDAAAPGAPRPRRRRLPPELRGRVGGDARRRRATAARRPRRSPTGAPRSPLALAAEEQLEAARESRA